ncbi:PGDH-like protein [Mya arenaria]|uniref:15-hydroxyprostaglandin dehydrogenase [NAD(+)] n=1 Tax=Mya arenaria TaxID=6604 RepID=A0ABY7E1D2_MYAAR|nr:15-hydroxyprostaglandin dehydrogenase [NAD(+)]-like [Mya arenaria]XP_052795910.1 15-hydroxyprostaglandin dehydrogenase [NAD(+)]-like [Mya arenaria]WAR00971.1 PGDH-like protein [Mya arenaria]
MKIPGAVAIVTGGSRGLGRAFSVELLKRGARVCVADINEAEGRQTEAALQRQYGADKALFVKCDVTKDNDMKDLWRVAVERFTTVDLMVNNAGIMNETLVEETVQINLMGAMRGSMMAFEHMRKDRGGKGGVIINVASTAGLFPVFFMPTYAASKYALVGFTRSWASNPCQARFGVSWAVLCPAFTDTSMLSLAIDGSDPPLVTYQENKEMVVTTVKSIGINSVDDVSRAFVELVEKDDNNGAVVTVEKKMGGAVYRFVKNPNRL